MVARQAIQTSRSQALASGQLSWYIIFIQTLPVLQVKACNNCYFEYVPYIFSFCSRYDGACFFIGQNDLASGDILDDIPQNNSMWATREYGEMSGFFCGWGPLWSSPRPIKILMIPPCLPSVKLFNLTSNHAIHAHCVYLFFTALYINIYILILSFMWIGYQIFKFI